MQIVLLGKILLPYKGTRETSAAMKYVMAI